jgi:hypothetical protein
MYAAQLRNLYTPTRGTSCQQLAPKWVSQIARPLTLPATPTEPIELDDIGRHRSFYRATTRSSIERGSRRRLGRGLGLSSGSGSKLIGKLHRVSLRCSLLAECRLLSISDGHRPPTCRCLLPAWCLSPPWHVGVLFLYRE